MKAEKNPSQNVSSESQAPEQSDFDFEEAEIQARAKELRKEHDWTEPYAISVARIEFERKKRKKQSGQKEESD